MDIGGGRLSTAARKFSGCVFSLSRLTSAATNAAWPASMSAANLIDFGQQLGSFSFQNIQTVIYAFAFKLFKHFNPG
jgi:hypothetical protein